MSDFLAPDTSIALMQASQGESMKIEGNLKNFKKSSTKEIESAAQEFEAVFLAEMLKPMFEGTELEEPFGGGKGEEIFQSFLLQEYGKIVAQTGGVGIADQVRQELINIQEQSTNETISSE